MQLAQKTSSDVTAKLSEEKESRLAAQEQLKEAVKVFPN
jgi:hypothetical protein